MHILPSLVALPLFLLRLSHALPADPAGPPPDGALVASGPPSSSLAEPSSTVPVVIATESSAPPPAPVPWNVTGGNCKGSSMCKEVPGGDCYWAMAKLETTAGAGPVKDYLSVMNGACTAFYKCEKGKYPQEGVTGVAIGKAMSELFTTYGCMKCGSVNLGPPGGNVGRELISKLLDDGHFQVRALLRSTSKPLPPAISKAVTTTVVDYDDPASLRNAFRDQDAVVCCFSGATITLAKQKVMIDAAIAAGVKLYFASEFVANILNPLFTLFPTELVGEKVEVRRYLEEKASEGRLAYTALNGGPFFDMWLNKGVAGFDMTAKTAKIYGPGDSVLCWTPLPVIANAAVRMLRNPNQIANRAIFVCGVKGLTQNALLAALQEEIKENFKVQHLELEPIKANATRSLGEGDLRAGLVGLTLNSVFNGNESAADFWNLVENEVVGVEAVTVQEAVREWMRSVKASTE
ncbi:MAG: hypothetical protein M1817_002483 [Caeruleum heppii]|nr:MAG: hypothetical protein M1817_002483 [Caeruleum heppii]